MSDEKKVACRIVFRRVDEDTYEIVFEGDECKEILR